MTDTEKIQSCLNEMMSGAGGMLSVQTIYSIMRRLLEEEPSMSLGGARIHLAFIASYAKNLSEEIEQWTYKGRFSEALFDHHYLQPGNDETGIYSDLKSVLMKLDATYQEQFRIASAIRYLFDVARHATMLRNEFSNNN